LIGRRISHYRITAKLGAGGMGVVYRAHDERLGRDVAFKVLPEGAIGEELARRRFRREAQALSRLNHPSIATIHDFDTHEGLDFLVMEWVPGKTLAEMLLAGPLPEDEVVALGAQIAAALEAAHEHGVVHRDLKPGNIMVTPKGLAKVLDFGLARLLGLHSSGATMSTAGDSQTVAGTLLYMPPEALRGDPPDARSDIYSLGAVLYEMATGRRPHDAPTLEALIYGILNHAVPPPTRINPRLTARLESVIVMALEKDPTRRYQTATQLSGDLRALGTPDARTLAQRRGPPARRIIAAAGVVAILAAGVLLATTPLGRHLLRPSGSTPIRSLAVLPLENLTGDSGEDYVAYGMTEGLINSLSRLGALRVISRTSSMRYQGTRKSLPEIGRELRVDVVVEGSVMRSGNRVRINARLIRPATEQTLWTEAYEREAADLLHLQSDVAQAIAREVKVELTPQERAVFAAPARVNAAAYADYLRGRFWFGKGTEDGYRMAMQSFQRAIDQSPNLALAHAGIAEAYLLLLGAGSLSFAEAIPRARASALRALELDDASAEVHATMSMLLRREWKWDAAERESRRAIEINPNYAIAHVYRAHVLAHLDRHDEALTEMRRAVELDPVTPTLTAILGALYLDSRQYARAIEECGRALSMDPDQALALSLLGQSRQQQGRVKEALTAFRHAVRSSGGQPLYLADLGYAFAASGHRDSALVVLKRLEGLSGRRRATPFQLGLVHLGLGDRDQALALFTRACDERQGLEYAHVDPRMDLLRPDPRFQAVVRCLRLRYAG